MKLEPSGHNFEKKNYNIEFNKNPFSESRVVPRRLTDGRMDMTKLIVAFRNSAEAHTKSVPWKQMRRKLLVVMSPRIPSYNSNNISYFLLSDFLAFFIPSAFPFSSFILHFAGSLFPVGHIKTGNVIS